MRVQDNKGIVCCSCRKDGAPCTNSYSEQQLMAMRDVESGRGVMGDIHVCYTERNEATLSRDLSEVTPCSDKMPLSRIALKDGNSRARTSPNRTALKPRSDQTEIFVPVICTDPNAENLSGREAVTFGVWLASAELQFRCACDYLFLCTFAVLWSIGFLRILLVEKSIRSYHKSEPGPSQPWRFGMSSSQ